MRRYLSYLFIDQNYFFDITCTEFLDFSRKSGIDFVISLREYNTILKQFHIVKAIY